MLACDLVCSSITAAELEFIHTRGFALATLDTVRTALVQEAAADNLAVREFACTLLVALVAGDRASFWQIGDGAICFRLLSEEHFRFAFWPDKGEYANVTSFVTDDDSADKLEFDSFVGRLADLALLSDGLERLALDFSAGEVHTRFFTGFFSHLYRQPPGHLEAVERDLADFLASDRINKKTDDDKTLVLATIECV